MGKESGKMGGKGEVGWVQCYMYVQPRFNVLITYSSILSDFPKLLERPTRTEPPPERFSCLLFFLTLFCSEDFTLSRKLCTK